MLEKGKAALLLSPDHPNGVWAKLNNGDKFLISSLPIGTRGKKFLASIKELDDADLTSEVGMDLALSFMHQILQLSYPDITLEDVDGLFDMAHFKRAMAYFYGASESEYEKMIRQAEADAPLPDKPTVPKPAKPAEAKAEAKA